MKKIKYIIILFIILATVFFVAKEVTATDFNLNTAGKRTGFTSYSNLSSITSIVSLGISILLGLLALVFFAIMMYAGLRWMTAAGEDEKITKAKTALKAGVIGMAIVVGSYGISYFIFTKLSGYSDTNTKSGYCVFTPVAPPNQIATDGCSPSTKDECDSLVDGTSIKSSKFYTAKPGGQVCS